MKKYIYKMIHEKMPMVILIERHHDKGTCTQVVEDPENETILEILNGESASSLDVPARTSETRKHYQEKGYVPAEL